MESLDHYAALLNAVVAAGTLLAAVAALITARATFLSVRELKEQRRWDQSPQLQILAFSRPIYGCWTNISGTLLAWPWRRTRSPNDLYRLEVVNLGRGAAVEIQVNWYYDAAAFIREAETLVSELDIKDHFSFDHNRLEVRFPNADYWSFHYVDYVKRSISDRKSAGGYFDSVLPRLSSTDTIEFDFSHHVQQLVALLIRLHHHVAENRGSQSHYCVDLARLNRALSDKRITVELKYLDILGNAYTLEKHMKIVISSMASNLDEQMKPKLQRDQDLFWAHLVPFEGERAEVSAYGA